MAAFCPKCGKSYEGAPSFCPNCGVSLAATMSPEPSPQRGPQKASHTGRNVGVVIVIILLVVGVIWILSGQGAGLGGIGSPSTVDVSGFASTNGLSTHAVQVIFTSNTGQIYNAPVTTSSQSGGTFDIQLPNNAVYQVQIYGTGALGYTGSCNAGTLSVNQGFGSGGLTESYSC